MPGSVTEEAPLAADVRPPLVGDVVTKPHGR
jgi:hypothetical protein